MGFLAKGVTVHEDVKEILFSQEQIQQRVKEIGAALTEEYAPIAARGEKIVLLSVLRGAAIFMCDLAREVKLPLEMDFMAVSSNSFSFSIADMGRNYNRFSK